MFDAFTPADAGEDLGLFVEPLGGNEDGDRPADDLLGSIAEHPLGPPVPTGDDAVEVLRKDRVLSRVYNGREFLRRSLGLLAPRDVNQHVHRADQRARRVEQRRGVGDKGHAPAVGTLTHRLHAAVRLALPERHRHWALIMRQRPSVWPVQLPRPTPGLPQAWADDPRARRRRRCSR